MSSTQKGFFKGLLNQNAKRSKILIHREELHLKEGSHVVKVAIHERKVAML